MSAWPGGTSRRENARGTGGCASMVGVAFQFPERGFFAATVRDEIGLTPTVLGWSAGSIQVVVERALAIVGLDGKFLDRSPFRLSGGQKRRLPLQPPSPIAPVSCSWMNPR